MTIEYNDVDPAGRYLSSDMLFSIASAFRVELG